MATDPFTQLRAQLGGVPGPHRARRPADDVWDALVAACGMETPHAHDKAMRGRLGRCVRALMDMEATPSDVRERASRYRVVMGDRVLITPEALVKHWAACAPPRRLKGSHMRPEMPNAVEERVTFHEAMARLNGAMDTRAGHMRDP